MPKINCIEPLVKVNRILSKEGLLPNGTGRKQIHIVQLTLHTLLAGTALLFMIINGINAIKTGNGRALIHSVCTIMPGANLVVKLVVVLVKKETLLSLLGYLKSDVFNSHSDELNGYVRVVHGISELIWKYYIVVIAGYVFVVGALPILLDTKTMQIPPPFDMGRYEILYKFLHVVICIYFGINSICLDVLFMSLIGLCIAQLYILEKRLIYVLEEVDRMCENRDPKEMSLCEERILKFCIILHESLNQ